MPTRTAEVVINQRNETPLSDYMVSFLTVQKNESPYLDFKETLELLKNDFAKVAKDIFGFSNYGGGWILLGWKETKNKQYVPVGLSPLFSLEQSTLQSMFNAYVDNPISIDYREISIAFNPNDFGLNSTLVNSVSKRFGIIYVPPSNQILKPKKDGIIDNAGKPKTMFLLGEILYRRGTQNVNPSPQEIKIIQERIKKENYRLSVLSGEPDEVTETIFSNLFELSKIPQKIYSAKLINQDVPSIKAELRRRGVFPEFYPKFAFYEGRLITFDNLRNVECPFHEMFYQDSINEEHFQNWISDENRNRKIIELLNKELIHQLIKNRFYFMSKSQRIFYPAIEGSDKRFESWSGRFAKSNRQVVSKMYAQQLGKYVYLHSAVEVRIIQVGNGYYLRLRPTMVLTEDGKKPLTGDGVGPVITRLTYNSYNNSQFMNTLFWISKLGGGKNINIGDYLEISLKPIELTVNQGIVYDAFSSDLKDKEMEMQEIPEVEFSDDL